MKYEHLGWLRSEESQPSYARDEELGVVIDKAASFSIMEQALEHRINLFGTADVYGAPQSPDTKQGYGISEEIIRCSLCQGGSREFHWAENFGPHNLEVAFHSCRRT